MRVVAALGAGFRIAAWPHAGIHRIPGPLGDQRRGGHQPLQGRQVHAAGVEGSVYAAPAALTARGQTQMRGRFAGGGAQQRIHELKQGVASAPKPRVHLRAEGSELFQFWRMHNQKDELASLFLSTPASPTRGC